MLYSKQQSATIKTCNGLQIAEWGINATMLKHKGKRLRSYRF